VVINEVRTPILCERREFDGPRTPRTESSEAASAALARGRSSPRSPAARLAQTCARDDYTRRFGAPAGSRRQSHGGGRRLECTTSSPPPAAGRPSGSGRDALGVPPGHPNPEARSRQPDRPKRLGKSPPIEAVTRRDGGASHTHAFAWLSLRAALPPARTRGRRRPRARALPCDRPGHAGHPFRLARHVQPTGFAAALPAKKQCLVSQQNHDRRTFH
jgi:hypothetical protein